ncbi:hypothetical protein NDU88_010069 [Pleurodeles waltl]|uniref:Uncharacterized protein n=1 Tax=Pleurodeles waltl TaxID=8319 RepID=A0AAV7RX18_PLEWA|nr:hypothetical protein NDU88_010069 [Pleurodeles waltl]
MEVVARTAGKPECGTRIETCSRSIMDRTPPTPGSYEGESAEGAGRWYEHVEEYGVTWRLGGLRTVIRAKLDLILQEIRDTTVIMDQKLGAITSDLNLLKDDQHKLTERVKSREQALVTLQPAQTEQVSMLKQLHKHVEQLQERAEDTKGKAHRNNIRIGRSPHSVHRDLVTDDGGTRGFTHPLHCGVGALCAYQETGPQGPARLIVAQILNYRDRDGLLWVAWVRARLRWLAPDCLFTPITRCWCSVTGLPSKKLNDTSHYTALYMH